MGVGGSGWGAHEALGHYKQKICCGAEGGRVRVEEVACAGQYISSRDQNGRGWGSSERRGSGESASFIYTKSMPVARGCRRTESDVIEHGQRARIREPGLTPDGQRQKVYHTRRQKRSLRGSEEA